MELKLSMTTKTKKFLELIKNSRETTIICGAGISVASKVPLLGTEFLSYKKQTNGQQVTLSSLDFLKADPELFFTAYRKVFVDPIVLNGPNITHLMIQKLIKIGLFNHVVTSNIDTLQQRAGTEDVIELWDGLDSEICTVCGRKYGFSVLQEKIPRCSLCGGLIAPAVLVNHLAPNYQNFERAKKIVKNSDVLIYVGTSGRYYDFESKNGHSIVINPNNTAFDRRASLILRERSENFFNQLDKIIDIP